MIYFCTYTAASKARRLRCMGALIARLPADRVASFVPKIMSALAPAIAEPSPRVARAACEGLALFARRLSVDDAAGAPRPTGALRISTAQQAAIS